MSLNVTKAILSAPSASQPTKAISPVYNFADATPRKNIMAQSNPVLKFIIVSPVQFKWMDVQK
ncbi:MAG TPA: hypothetical protein DCQ83_04555 [Fibrobacteres bacterium]|nr:hypothetical protein [Fibrobacterota bacterium]